MDCFKERKEKRKTEHRYEKMAMNNYLSIITLNINGLSAPIKRHRVAEEVRKHYCTGAAYKRLTPEQKTYTD